MTLSKLKRLVIKIKINIKSKLDKQIDGDNIISKQILKRSPKMSLYPCRVCSRENEEVEGTAVHIINNLMQNEKGEPFIAIKVGVAWDNVDAPFPSYHNPEELKYLELASVITGDESDDNDDDNDDDDEDEDEDEDEDDDDDDDEESSQDDNQEMLPLEDEPKIKEPEIKELKPEIKEPEVKEPEIKESEVKEPEIKEPEIKEPEIKKSEVKNKYPTVGHTKK